MPNVNSVQSLSPHEKLTENTPISISLAIMIIAIAYLAGGLNERLSSHDKQLSDHAKWIKDISDIAIEARERLKRYEER